MPAVNEMGNSFFRKEHMSLKKYSMPVFILLFTLSQTARAVSASSILVAGYGSDNVVQFDPGTGRWSEIARLPQGAHPRGIAVGHGDEIYLGLMGLHKNVVRLTLNGSPQIKDVTGSIGRYGPGIIAFENGKLWAAGDTTRKICQIDPQTGAVSSPPQYEGHYNIVGLAADGGTLYAAEYFHRGILRYNPTTRGPDVDCLVSESPYLSRPVGMTIGRDGNLYVANALKPTVIEFDARTGSFIRTFINLGAAGIDGIKGIVYAPDEQRYYLASGSDVFEADTNGNIVATYSSPALKDAYGITILQTSSPDAANPNNNPLTMLRVSSNGRLEITGRAGERYEVMATTDFIHWQPIAVLKNSTGLVEFVDPDAGKHENRFYRLTLLPKSR